MITGITEISQITTKQDMSRWTRAHADDPGIHWSVFAGPGGTMIIVEHEQDRASLNMADVTSEIASTTEIASTSEIASTTMANLAESA